MGMREVLMGEYVLLAVATMFIGVAVALTVFVCRTDKGIGRDSKREAGE